MSGDIRSFFKSSGSSSGKSTKSDSSTTAKAEESKTPAKKADRSKNTVANSTPVESKAGRSKQTTTPRTSAKKSSKNSDPKVSKSKSKKKLVINSDEDFEEEPSSSEVEPELMDQSDDEGIGRKKNRRQTNSKASVKRRTIVSDDEVEQGPTKKGKKIINIEEEEEDVAMPDRPSDLKELFQLTTSKDKSQPKEVVKEESRKLVSPEDFFIGKDKKDTSQKPAAQFDQTMDILEHLSDDDFEYDPTPSNLEKSSSKSSDGNQMSVKETNIEDSRKSSLRNVSEPKVSKTEKSEDKEEISPKAKVTKKQDHTTNADLFLFFSGKRFVLSGDFSLRSKSDISDIILQYGGRVTSAISKVTSYLVIGDNPGPAKMTSAKNLEVEIMSEGQFLEMVEDFVSKLKTSEPTSDKKAIKKEKTPVKAKQTVKSSGSTDLWVDKYKPKSLQDIIGNANHVKKLSEFLNEWSSESKTKAALLSGPPGIGKTTTAILVSELNGFKVIEFNASDTRSQKNLRERVSDLMDNRTINEFQESEASSHGKQHKLVLVMDEVDGMSSGDRGGISELIKMIKSSKIPVICICNERGDPKMRTLANYCLDLRFRRPTKTQIATKLVKAIENEGFQIDQPALEKLCDSCRSDIRLVLNTLQFWSSQNLSMSFQDVKDSISGQMKDFDAGPFDVINFFFEKPSSRNWINERTDFYFCEMSLVPLMVFDKYAVCNSDVKGLRELEKLADAAETISQSDLLDSQFRSTASFSHLPLHASLSCVIPGAYVAGFGGRGPPNFPSWLGKNSTRRKNTRLFREMKVHMSRVCTGDSLAVELDYAPVLKNHLMNTLINEGKEGIEFVIQTLDEYGLSLDDFETLQAAPFSTVLAEKIETKVKTQLTKTYKQHHEISASRNKKAEDTEDVFHYEEENDDNITGLPMQDEEETESSQETENVEELTKQKSVKSKGPAKGRSAGAKTGGKRSTSTKPQSTSKKRKV